MSMFDPDDDSEDPGPATPFSDDESDTKAPATVPDVKTPPQSVPENGNSEADANDYLVDAEAPQDKGPDHGAAPQSPASADDEESDWLKPVPVPAAVSLKPYQSSDSDLAALKAQYAKEATQNTQPSVWRRIAAGLSGGAVAFGSHNPAEGVSVARGVLNAPAERAAAQNAREEKPLVQAVQNDQAANAETQRENNLAIEQGNEADRNYRNQVEGQRQQGQARNFAAQAQARRDAPIGFTPDDPNNPYAGGTVKTADGRLLRDQPPPDKWLANWERDPANKARAEANAGVIRLRQMDAAGIKTTPEQRAIIASGGKVTPAVRTTVSIREGNGTQPQDDAGSLIAKNIQDKQSFIDRWQRVDKDHAGPGAPEGSYVAADTDLNDVKNGDFKPSRANFLTGPQFNQKVDKFRTDLNAEPAMRKAGVSLDETGNMVHQPRGAAPNRITTTTTTSTNGAPHTFSRAEIPAKVALPAGHVWVKAPADPNGKPGAIGYIPQANLAKAIARGYAVPEGQ